MFPSFL